MVFQQYMKKDDICRHFSLAVLFTCYSNLGVNDFMYYLYEEILSM